MKDAGKAQQVGRIKAGLRWPSGARSAFRRLGIVLWLGIVLLFGCVAGVAQSGASQNATPQNGTPQSGASQNRVPRPLVVEVLLHDTIQSVSAEDLQASLDGANAMKPAAILLNLSTPGGRPEDADRMAAMIERSAAPVIVFLRSPGTHVSGEGLRLLMAGAVRAMHPGALLMPMEQGDAGWSASGWGKANDRAQSNTRLKGRLETMLLAHRRSASSVDMLLAGTAPISSADASQAGLVDVVAGDEKSLMAALSSLPANASGSPVGTWQLQDARIIAVPLTLRGHLMRAMMNPDLTVLLLTLGGLLIYLEINTPGGVVPGAAGVLLVLLAVYAFGHMPLRWEGVVLLSISTLLLMVEALFHRGSVLAWFAIVALVLGLRLLVRGPIPELEVDWSTAIGAGVGFGGITAGLLLLAAKARRAKVTTGAEAMLGWLAVAQTALSPEGQVLVRGELWHARLSGNDAFLRAGECVKVQSSDGMTLEVAPMPVSSQA